MTQSESDVEAQPDDDHEPRISDYGFLSDGHSGALVGRNGSIDWWCVPRFDAPAVFGRLLDAQAGHWQLAPTEAFSVQRRYVDDTLVLETTFQTATGAVKVTDALLLEAGARNHEICRLSPHTLLRHVEGQRGRVQMRTDFSPRMEYGRTEPHLRPVDGGVEAIGGPVTLNLATDVPLVIQDGAVRADFDLEAGETVDLRLVYSRTFNPDGAGGSQRSREASLSDTVAGWTSWSTQHTGYDGAYPALVRRSSLVLQGLTYGPSGAVIAAATTSLPETMGGQANFDYRYAWLRDLSLTARSLWLAACPDEPNRLLDWLAGSAGRIRDELIQIMYGVEGERDLTEHTLPQLRGFGGSAPVRVGNAAWQQDQLDVFGEVLDAAHLVTDAIAQFSPPTTELLTTLADRAAQRWMTPDAGMWEARDRNRHYTSSKVMCWVALDRAIDLAARLGAETHVSAWTSARAAVRSAVLEQAWSDSAGAYAGALRSDDLDASVLILPLVGFLPADDQRMAATIETIEAQLGEGGLIRRWPSDRSGFLICSYWLVECLALAGHPERARRWFDRATAYANDLGLLAEEGDVRTGQLLGNFPQAFSHVGLINAAWRLGQVAG
ncbi:MAG: glycoside hydrolase family 15 protein [bacterium]